MDIAAIRDEHATRCDGKLKIFTLDNERVIHVELYCEKCGSRYVSDIYTMTEV